MNNDTSDENAGFLKRWSRVKTGVEEDPGAQPIIDEKPLPEVAEESALLDAEQQTVKILTDEDMPPIESLHEGSDFGGFLSESVSTALRKAALKKLFSQPGFNIRDGLNDYDDDYTSFAPLGDTVTVEMTYRAEVDAKREALKKALLEEQAEAEAMELAESSGETDEALSDQETADQPDTPLELPHSQENPDELKP